MFDQVMARIAGRFGRVEPRATARSYLLGLLSNVERTGRDSGQAAALVHLAQTPPGNSPTQPLPTTNHRRTRWIDHETVLEY
ncbi:hypothetical protein ACIODT_30140 [Streptomyces sp. NPDC088251]|uniref:hypothetical protein n=1 Tax=unclassified Streptomyces TaxID=2593676 RepID=UPI0033CDD0EB